MAVLETDGLEKAFGELRAVDGVSIEVERETIFSVIGPNGAGKSTLFNLITGLYEPTAGTVTYRGEDVTGLAPFRLARRGIARSFQITDIFDGLTARENVRLAAQVTNSARSSVRKRADDLVDVNERTETVLADIGLTDVADLQAGNLDYGNQRKLELGLVIAIDPELLLLDEPTAGMGKEDTGEMIELVKDVTVQRGITVMLIEHDIEVVMNISDEIAVLHRGSVIANGPPEEISEDAEVQHAYLGGDIYEY